MKVVQAPRTMNIKGDQRTANNVHTSQWMNVCITVYDRPNVFLSNESKNAQFVDLLNQHLVSDGHTAKKSGRVGYTLIVFLLFMLFP